MFLDHMEYKPTPTGITEWVHMDLHRNRASAKLFHSLSTFMGTLNGASFQGRKEEEEQEEEEEGQRGGRYDCCGRLHHTDGPGLGCIC